MLNRDCFGIILRYCDGKSIDGLRHAYPCLYKTALANAFEESRAQFCRVRRRLDRLNEVADRTQAEISAIWAIASLYYIECACRNDPEIDNFGPYADEVEQIVHLDTTGVKLIEISKELLCSNIEVKIPESAFDRPCMCSRIVENTAVWMRDLTYILLLESDLARKGKHHICCGKLSRITKEFMDFGSFRTFYKLYTDFFTNAHNKLNTFLDCKRLMFYVEDQYLVLKYSALK